MRALTAFARRPPVRWAAVPVAVGGVVAAVLVMGASPSSATYRTAEVTTGDVTQTLTATGSIESASRSDLAFQVGGTVDAVDVAVGDTVAAGDVLATLDTEDLDDAVAAAEEALAEAEQALADDLEAQSEGTSGSSTTSTSSASSTAGTATATAAVLTAAYTPSATGTAALIAETTEDDEVEAARAALATAQDDLLAQYDVAQALLVEAQQASAGAQEVCAAFANATSEDGSDTTATDDPASDASEAADPTDAAAVLAACQEATAAALAASEESIEAQATLMDLASTVDQAIAALQDAITAAQVGADAGAGVGGTGTDAGDGAASGEGGPSGGEPGTDAGDASGGDADMAAEGSSAGSTPADGSTSDAAGSGNQGAMSGAGASAAVPSAADILADKAEITAAEADLAVAEAQIAHATLVAPVAGEIVAVTFADGDTVTAGDSTAVITLVGDNTYLVSLSVSLTEAQLLAVGQEAAVTLTASGDVVEGTVSSVGTVNAGNSFSQSYAVTIAIADPGFDIRIGASTRMVITVAGASGVLVVPTSAVSDAAGDATVQVVGSDGTATAVAIEAGAIGAVHTEVVSGLEAGDEVVLADLSQELTSDEDSGDESSGLLSGLSSEDDSSDTQQMPQGGFPGGGMAPGAGMQG